MEEELKEAEKFIAMPLKNRIDFIKELLAEAEEDEEKIVETSTARAKALKFLNALETLLSRMPLDKHKSKGIFDTQAYCSHIFKVREFLNQPGSSVKTLIESVALIVPSF